MKTKEEVLAYLKKNFPDWAPELYDHQAHIIYHILRHDPYDFSFQGLHTISKIGEHQTNLWVYLFENTGERNWLTQDHLGAVILYHDDGSIRNYHIMNTSALNQGFTIILDCIF